MNLLASLIEGVPTVPAQDGEPTDGDLLLWGGKNRFIGFVLGNEIVALDFKHFFSFRIKLANARTIPKSVKWFPRVRPIASIEYLKQYFSACEDNPYAVWNGICNSSEEFIGRLTEFPPLFRPKDAALQRAAIETMYENAQPADSVFTFDRSSRISKIIRNADRGMWSHVGMVTDRRTLIEATTSGVVESNFFRLSEPVLDVGLYRLRDQLDGSKFDEVVNELRSEIGKSKFNWSGVLRIYFEKRWGIGTWRRRFEMTPADLMSSNRFHLVCYA